jgi:2-polyprenyl-6-methoxyphenol hydroxylase-like FAD-dependent oxidoreductase
MSARETERQVLVVGAGVAGLTLGAFLRRQGLDPVLVDRSGVGECPEAGVALWSNGLSVLDCLGVLDEVRTAGTVVSRVTTRTPDGTVVDSRVPDYGTAHPFVTVTRASLCRILREHVPDVTVRPRTGVENLRSVDGATEVRFDDGVRETFDVVVGADGPGSRTREQAFDEDAASGGGTTWWFRVPTRVDAPDATTEVRDGDGRQFLYVPHPGGGTAYLRADGDATGLEREGTVEARRRSFDRFEWLLPAAMAHLDDEDLSRADLPGGPRWTTDRVALVGDAVRGGRPGCNIDASLGLEDAFVLTDELLTRPVPAALRQYASRRLDRLARLRERTGGPNGADRPLSDRVRAFLAAHDDLMGAFFEQQRRSLGGTRLDGD